jgi:hypothetical protein
MSVRGPEADIEMLSHNVGLWGAKQTSRKQLSFLWVLAASKKKTGPGA